MEEEIIISDRIGNAWLVLDVLPLLEMPFVMLALHPEWIIGAFERRYGGTERVHEAMEWIQWVV